MFDILFNLLYLINMTYIWNRAERVTQNMPNVVIESFKKWEDDIKRDWAYLPEEKKQLIRYRITREKNKMNESLVKLGYAPQK